MNIMFLTVAVPTIVEISLDSSTVNLICLGGGQIINQIYFIILDNKILTTNYYLVNYISRYMYLKLIFFLIFLDLLSL